MLLDGNLLTLEMQPNGEFSVIRMEGRYDNEVAGYRIAVDRRNAEQEVSGERNRDGQGRNAAKTVEDKGNLGESEKLQDTERSGQSGSNVFDVDGQTVRYSTKITPKQDADYAAAVERGDTETAQRMVDEAAKAAGYTIHAYHGTARADRLYLFEADGYMSGHIVEKINLNTKAKYARDARKEFLRGTDKNSKIAGLWSDTVSNIRGESGNGVSVPARERGKNAGNDQISRTEREGDGAGNYDGTGEDFEDVSEYGPGAMYYDGENGYVVNEDGN